MSEETSSPVNIKLQDVLGISKPAEILVAGIVQGIGALGAHVLRGREERRRLAFLRSAKPSLQTGKLDLTLIDLELGERTSLRMKADTSRHQENRENVAAAAIDEFQEVLGEGPQPHNSASENDMSSWFDRFWRLAEMSNGEDMQRLWGRVLAHRALGTVGPSPRLLEFVSLMSVTEMRLIERISSFVITAKGYNGSYMGCVPELPQHSERQLSIMMGDRQQDVLGPIGFYVQNGRAYQLHAFEEAGVTNIAVAGRKFTLVATRDTPLEIAAGLQVSPLGLELCKIARGKPSPQYIAFLTEQWRNAGISMEPSRDLGNEAPAS